MIDDWNGTEELVGDVEIVEDTPPQGGRGYGPAANTGWQPEAVDLEQRRTRRGRAIVTGALAGVWVMLPFGVKLLIWLAGPVVVLLLLLGVVSFAAPLLLDALFYPPAWPLVVLAVTWLMARRRRDGRGPVEHVKALSAATRTHLKVVRTGVVVGAAVGLIMGVVGYLQGGGTILDGVLTVCGATAAVGLAFAAYLESRQ